MIATGNRIARYTETRSKFCTTFVMSDSGHIEKEKGSGYDIDKHGFIVLTQGAIKSQCLHKIRLTVSDLLTPYQRSRVRYSIQQT